MSEVESPADDMLLADLFAFIQTKAIESKDERVQALADAAYQLLDERVIKAMLLQRAASSHDTNQRHAAMSPIHQMLDRSKR